VLLRTLGSEAASDCLKLAAEPKSLSSTHSTLGCLLGLGKANTALDWLDDFEPITNLSEPQLPQFQKEVDPYFLR
jgi:hypothetical protein